MNVLDCRGMHYREINARLEEWWRNGCREALLQGVNGQRYLGRAFSEGYLEIEGTPGDDVGIFLNGATVRIKGNGQDGVGNTMNRGKIIVEGDARDIVGFSMRGGKIWVRGSVGYRVGIHMKSYLDEYPVIIVGGEAGDFLGEYMAGGLIVILGLGSKKPIYGSFIAPGMHGGTIIIRGEVSEKVVSAGVKMSPLEEHEWRGVSAYLEEYSHDLALSLPSFRPSDFVKLFPLTTRPYGRIYAY